MQNYSNLLILKRRFNPRKLIKGPENVPPLGENCFLCTKWGHTDLWLIRLLCSWNSLSQAGEWCQGRTSSPSNSSSPELLPLCLTLPHFPACQVPPGCVCTPASAAVLSILLFHCSLSSGQGRAEGSSTLTQLNGVDQSVMPMWFSPSFASVSFPSAF